MSKFPKNKTIIFLGTIIFAFFLLPKISWAANYYIDFNSGDNSNNGSFGSPWKELPGTVSPTAPITGWVTIAAGDTILLAAGQTWTKSVRITSSYYANPTNEAGRITIKSDSATTKAIFDYTAGGGTYGFNVQRDYITLQYLEIRNITASRPYGVYIGNATQDDYVKVLNSYIHDIIDTAVITGSPGSCSGENYSYGVVIVWTGAGTEIAYNIFKNIDKKFIGTSESATTGSKNLSIHHNVFYNASDFTGDPIDHGIVLSGSGHSYYNNIIWNNHKYYGKNIAINAADGSDNKIYNNIIRGWNIGIGLRTAQPGNNKVYHNTIYLAEQPATRHTCYYDEQLSHAGIYIESSTYNEVRNNIIYYPRLISGGGGVMVWVYSGSNNTITNNLMYRTGLDEIAATGSITFRTISYMENTWDGSSGNVWQNNVIANPNFSGGNHTVSNLPDGFDSNWYPNNKGLQLTSLSTSAINAGYDNLGSPYNIDIAGQTRSDYDIGAYEYAEAAPPADTTPPSPPSGVIIQ